MKFSEDADLAVTYVRKAIPAMMQYKIVPNPINFTLWYTYFANTSPELNKQLDHIIERYNTCPHEISEALFLQHIGNSTKNEFDTNEAFQNAINKMVNDLSETISHTSSQTNEFSNALKGDIRELNEHIVDDSLSPLLNNLTANATAICDANESFNGQLSLAQREISRLKIALENSKQEANTDPLTGLSNRRVLENIYKNFASSENSSELSLVILDIDKFKLFNDTHGHLVGDQILKYVAKLLKDECASDTQAVRFGGEEFAVICPNYDLSSSQKLAEKLRAKLASMPFTNKKTGEKIPPITASFGVATRQDNEALESILERADKALYCAKASGRNQVQLAN